MMSLLKLKRASIWTVIFVFMLALIPAGAHAENSKDEWQIVGQTGGTTKALLTEETTLYVGSGLHVLILDVSSPEKMQVLGTSPLLPDFVESITSDGAGRLFVSCGLGGLVVLDVTNPKEPLLLSVLDTRGYTESVTLLDNLAIVADGPQGVQIIDVTNPAKMKTLSEAFPLAYAYDIAISDKIAYIAGGGSGVFTVDLTNPIKPVEAGLTSLDGFTYDLEILKGKLYAACAWGGIAVLDLKEPLAPKSIATAQTSGWAMALSAFGNDLLVLDGADGVMVYGAAPTIPVRLSAYTLGGFVLDGAVSGTTAFVLDREKGLLTLDLSKKTNPDLICRWMPLLEGRRLTMQDGVCYVAGGLSGMHVFDVANIASPNETYWYDTGGGYANKVILADSKAYLSTHLASNEPLVIFDSSNLIQPRKLGFVPNDEAVFNTAFRSISYADGMIYVPGEFHDMAVDVRDSAHPTVVNKIGMENPVNGDCSAGLYISTSSTQLQLIDVTDPMNLRLISQLQKNSSGEAIRFINPTTVITSADPGIWIVDVSDPQNPKRIAELAIPGGVMDIFIDGTTAYLSNLGNGIQIVDLSDLNHPVLKDSFTTIGLAYDCYAKDGLIYVADSFAGMTVYQKGNAQPKSGDSDAASSASNVLSIKTGEEPYSLNLMTSNQPTPTEAFNYNVTSAADSGEGTLRYALEHLDLNTMITFDPTVFPVAKPVSIALESPLPEITWDHLTIDASNAGVILDGSKLENGNGLTIYSFYNRIMGLQIVNFPQHGIDLQGGSSVVGGNRNVGSGSLGQGNLLSGNGLYGIRVGGFDQTVLGNFVGIDISGEKAMPNYDGIFVGEALRVTIGGTEPGEGNVISGNQFINFDSWGDQTRVIGNLIGLNAKGTKAVVGETSNNVVLESNVMNNIVGGTTPGERNVISGAGIGVVFSDPNSYCCSVIGNYIGTDITGTKAIPNQDGITMWTSGNHRVGGTRAGEANLISGNLNGVQLNGYGVSDNIVLGNIIGYDANGKPLPNETPVSVNMGQKHAIIGGYTQQEGNRIYGGSISMRITNRGIQACYIAGNYIDNPNGLGIYFEDGANDNFVQGNTFGKSRGNILRVDFGDGNMLRSNAFAGQKAQDIILLLEGGNSELAAPTITSAIGTNVSGETCAFGRVEVYLFEKTGITSIGFVLADQSGAFSFKGNASLSGKQLVLLVTDVLSNTSIFSQPYTVS